MPPIIIDILIWLYGVLSFLLDTICEIFCLIKKIKFKTHILCAVLSSAGYGAYSYYAQNALDLLCFVKLIGLYLAVVLAIKVLSRPFDKLCTWIRMDVRSYYLMPGLSNYIVMSPKELYKENNMNKTYQLQMDFGAPVMCFTDLHQVFEALKQNDHIFVFSTLDDRCRKVAKDHEIDPEEKPFYIETSVSEEGVFVQSVEAWIDDDMVDEFYNPEKRPYIEVFL